MQTYPSGDQNPGPLSVDDIGNNPLRETNNANDPQADNIRHVQLMLFELGYLLGQRSKVLDGVDGIFGPDTDAAVRQFQREHKDWAGTNLVVDGIVGHKTSDALNREMVGVWFDSYFSVDKDGNNVPTDSPLLTVDFDAAIPAFTGPHTVAIHGFPLNTPAGPDRSCNLFPNDPGAQSDAPLKEVYLLHLRPSSGETIPSWKLADDKTASGTTVGPAPANFPPPGRFDPGESDSSSPAGLEFQRCQVHVTLSRAVRMWRMNGLRFGSWPGVGGVLPVILQHDSLQPRLNGMFTGSDLELGFHDVAKIWTAESADITAHELGHAILQASAPLIANSPQREARAFNESFADITAILTTLTDADVRKALIDGSGGDLVQSSFVTKLTEQVGVADATRDDVREELKIMCPPGTVVDLGVINYPFTDTDCVRNAFNDFKYLDPSALPCMFGPGENFHNKVIWPTVVGPSGGGSEKPHGFSRIFSGAFYDSLANAFNRLKSSASSDDEALRQAAGGMAKILARAILRSPSPATQFYKQLAKKMFEADRTNFAKTFRGDMMGSGDANGFVGRDILTEAEVNAISPA